MPACFGGSHTLADKYFSLSKFVNDLFRRLSHDGHCCLPLCCQILTYELVQLWGGKTAVATDLADMFTDEPDFTPYTALPSDMRIFDPQKALDPLDEEFDWEALGESPIIDYPVDMLRECKEKEEYRLEDRQ